MPIDPQQLEYRDIAKRAEMSGPREMLEFLFNSNQADWSPSPIAQRPSFKAVAIEADLQAAAGDCLFYADQDGWMPQLAEAISTMAPREKRERFLSDLLGDSAPPLKETLRRSRGLTYAINQACIIEHAEDGVLGTGMLISPDVVLTAHHVVDRYWTAGERDDKLRARFPPARFEPFPEPPDGRGLVVAFAKEWRIDGSPAPAGERDSRSWLAVPSLRENLDYALVRIASSAGLARGHPIPCCETGRTSPVWVFHAPSEAEVRASRGVIKTLYRGKAPLRLQYVLDDGENRPGSSGGACLDLQGRLIGHHQAGLGQMQNGSVCRAVPWSAVDASVRRNGADLTAGKPPYLWWVRTPDLMDVQHGFRQQIAGGPYYRPLVGRHVFQDAILASTGGDPLWRVFFAAGPAKAGTTLTLRILETLLHERDHIVAAIDVGSAMIQNRRYIDQMFCAVQEKAQSEKVVVPYRMEMPEPPSYAAVRSYVRARIEEMDALREGRLVWLTVDGLIQTPPANEFDRLSMEALVDVTPRYDWLRTVILSPRPAALPDTFFDPIDAPTDYELAYYVHRRLQAAGQTVTLEDASQLAKEIVQDASEVSGRPELTGVEAGLAIDAVLAHLYPAGTESDPIVRIKDPCW